MSEVNDEKIRAPKHVEPWSVRYSSGCADERSVWSVSTSDWAKVKFDDEVVKARRALVGQVLVRSLRSVSTSDWAKVKFDDEVVRWWWYRIRGKACESGRSVCDSIWKVPSVGHLGESHGGDHIRDAQGLELSVTFPCDFPWDARHLELSVCYHKHFSHFRTLFLLSCTITISLPHHQESLWRCSSLIKVSFVIN